MTPIRNPRTGSISYRVMGTIRRKQRKQHFADMAQAQTVQADWELERTLAAASVRPKPTRLTQQELAQAEAGTEMLRGTNLTIIDAVRHLLRNPPGKRVEMAFEAGYKAFLEDREGHVSDCQLDNHKSALSRLAKYLGPVGVADVSAESITAWLKSLDCSNKSWNLYRSSIGHSLIGLFGSHANGSISPRWGSGCLPQERNP